MRCTLAFLCWGLIGNAQRVCPGYYKGIQAGAVQQGPLYGDMCLSHLRRAKVKFVSESDAAEALSFIPPDVLPKTFGGAAPPLPVDEAVRKFGLAKPAQIAGPGKARSHRCQL